MQEKNIIKWWAFDEISKDSRDWVGNYWIQFQIHELPDEFVIDDWIYVSQNILWYKMSCSAQATVNAANWSRKIRLDCLKSDAFDLWDTMLEKWLGSEDTWAYLINAIKQAKTDWIIQWYYQTNTLIDILNAIYSTNLIITGSNKINWNNCANDWLVKEISVWSWHAFCIIWWDKNKQISNYKNGAIKCKNSYWKNTQDKWCFWIPFDLIEKVLFNTKKAVVVIPQWTQLTQETRFEKYLEIKNKYVQK